MVVSERCQIDVIVHAYYSCRLGGVLVSVLVMGLKVASSNPAKTMDF
jgi:hypothetical protein